MYTQHTCIFHGKNRFLRSWADKRISYGLKKNSFIIIIIIIIHTIVSGYYEFHVRVCQSVRRAWFSFYNLIRF